MTLYFEYGNDMNGRHTLEFTASLTMTLTIGFHPDGLAEYIAVKNYGMELYPSNEYDVPLLRSLYVKAGDTYYTLEQVIHEAEKELDDIVEAIEDEARKDAAHAKEMSSPYWTGRV